MAGRHPGRPAGERHAHVVYPGCLGCTCAVLETLTTVRTRVETPATRRRSSVPYVPPGGPPAFCFHRHSACLYDGVGTAQGPSSPRVRVITRPRSVIFYICIQICEDGHSVRGVSGCSCASSAVPSFAPKALTAYIAPGCFSLAAGQRCRGTKLAGLVRPRAGRRCG